MYLIFRTYVFLTGGMRLKKVFYEKIMALVFNASTGDLLMVRVPSNKKKLMLDFPNRIVEDDDILFGAEVWRSYVIGQILDQTKIISAKAARKMVQPIPACYHVDGENLSLECEGIIVGEIDFSPDNNRIFAIDPINLIDLTRKGSIARSTGILGLRVFASRDCPVEPYRQIAGRELGRRHQP